MSLEAIKDRLPDTARDLRVNLGNLLTSEHLSERQLYGTLVATAFTSRNRELLSAIEAEAEGKLSAEDVALAKSIATTMGMNNVYYRFKHLVEKPDDYGKLPARLRMQVLGAPAGDKVDRELWALAVSAVNGCGMCIAAHEDVLRKHEVTVDTIHDAVRVAAVVFATAIALDQL
ncbi:MAG: alkyl hydroperoxide reductase [Planctomycetaceae bacterium]|nr:alkyl hydroperoxide reductase [Planctomycetaceae bacterium]